MEFRGAKGVWEAQEVSTKTGTYLKVTVNEGESICNITTRNQERQFANAKLIAAAPLMFEDLKNCLGFIEHLGDEGLIPDNLKETFGNIIMNTCLTLQKATEL